MLAGSGESIRWNASPEKGSDGNTSASAEGSSKKEKKSSKAPSIETERHLPPEARERFGQIFARPMVGREVQMPWQQAEHKKSDGLVSERPAHDAADEKKAAEAKKAETNPLEWVDEDEKEMTDLAAVFETVRQFKMK